MEYRRNTYGSIAKKDLAYATAALGMELSDPVCFYMHQALEKIIKQYLSLAYEDKDIAELPQSNKVSRLARKSGLGELQQFREMLWFLDDYYRFGRYPNVDYEDVRWEDAKKCYEDGIKAFELVEDAIRIKGKERE